MRAVYRNTMSKEEALQKELETYDIVAYDFVGNMAYAAIRHERGYVYCMILIFELQKRDMYVKTMAESYGPYYYAVPEVVKSALSSIEDIERLGGVPNDYMREWRSKVFGEVPEKNPVLEDGMIVLFDRMMSFEGFDERVFRVRKEGRSIFFEARGGKMCRIRDYQNHSFQQVTSMQDVENLEEQRPNIIRRWEDIFPKTKPS